MHYLVVARVSFQLTVEQVEQSHRVEIGQQHRACVIVNQLVGKKFVQRTIKLLHLRCNSVECIDRWAFGCCKLAVGKRVGSSFARLFDQALRQFSEIAVESCVTVGAVRTVEPMPGKQIHHFGAYRPQPRLETGIGLAVRAVNFAEIAQCQFRQCLQMSLGILFEQLSGQGTNQFLDLVPFVVLHTTVGEGIQHTCKFFVSIGSDQ